VVAMTCEIYSFVTDYIFFVILAYARIYLKKARELAHDTFGQAQMLQ